MLNERHYAMIARIWRGQATADNARHYRRHATKCVFPSLAGPPGRQGAYLLRRETGGQVEFLAVTLWDSLGAVKTFAGETPEIAVVEPEACALLSDFDDCVRHYEVAHGPSCAATWR
jgi:heme-degrading monooxygenase HmoA